MTETWRVVAIGDSVIYGRHDPGGGWIGRLRLALESRDKWSAVFNLGIGGQTSSDIIARFTSEVTPRTPNTVVIGCGLNDFRGEGQMGSPIVSVDLFETNLNRILVEAHAIGIQRRILAQMNKIDTSSQEVDGFCYPADRWREYNQAISRLGRKHEAAILHFGDLGDFSIASGSLSDRVHPSPRGHSQMAEMAVPLLLGQ